MTKTFGAFVAATLSLGVICGTNIPILSLQSFISNSGAKTWGFYAVRTDSGDSQFHFGVQSDAYSPGLDAWTCTQSAGTPTGCIFSPVLAVTSTSTGGTPFEMTNTSGSGSAYNLALTGSSSALPNNGLALHDVTNGPYTMWFSNTTKPGAWTLPNGVFGWSSNTPDPRAGGSSGLDTGLVRASAGVICASASPFVASPACTGTLTATQFLPAGSTPTIAAGAAAGSSPTVSVVGTNTSGVFSVTTGTATAPSATLATITFNGTLAGTPFGCQVTARNALAAAASTAIFTTAPSITSWTIAVGASALIASTAYSWSYLCM